MSTHSAPDDPDHTLAVPMAVDFLRLFGLLLLGAGAIALVVNVAAKGGLGFSALVAAFTGAAILITVYFGRLARAASFLCWGLILAGVAGVDAIYGGLSLNWAVLPLAPLAGGWLLGRRMAVILALAAAGSALGLYGLKAQGFALPHYLPPEVAWIALPVLLVLVASACHRRSKTARLGDQRPRASDTGLERPIASSAVAAWNAGEPLRVSDEGFRKLFEGTRQASALYQNGRFLMVNRAALELMKIDRPERIVGHNPVEFSPHQQPDGQPSAAKAARMINQAFAEGSSSFEWELTRPDGTRFLAQVLATAIRQNGQELLHIVFHDITEHKRSEARLRESEERYRLLVEQSVDGILVHDAELRYVEANPSACRMLGYSREELLGLTVADMIAPDEIARVVPDIDRFARGEVRPSEYRCRRMDGSTFLGEVVGSPLPDGKFLGILRDITERKHLETLHLENERRLRSALEGSGQGVWDWDIGTGEVYFSPLWKAMVGYGEDELPNRIEAWQSRLHPDDKPPVMAALEAYFLGQSDEYAAEYRFRCKDGGYRWIQAKGISVERTAAGRPRRIIGVHLDIHARKQAEQALGNSEALLRATLEATADGILVVNDRGRVLAANRRFQELWRIPDGVLTRAIDAELTDYMSAQLQEPATFLDTARALRAGDAVIADTLRFSDGRVFERYSVPLRGEGQLARLCSYRDVSERERAYAALGESEQRFRQIADSAPVLIWMAGLDQGCHFFNQVWLDFTGRTLEQESGNGWVEGVHPDDLPRCLDIYLRSFDARESFRSEYRLRRHDGQYRWILDQGSPRYSRDGAFLGYIGSCIDITEMTEIRETLERVNSDLETRTREAEAANQAKSRFLAHMSHELRTPLNAILGFAQILEHEMLTDDQRTMVTMMHEAGDSLLRIINDVLDLAKIEAGKLRLEQQAFALPPVLDRVERLMSRLARDKGLVFEVCHPEGDCGSLLGDPQRIEQVLVNLVGNAIKFTDHGEVRLKVTAIPSPATRLRFAIHDTGDGIAPEVLNRLFQPFSQGDSSISRRHGGTGLGLVISQRMVEQMGGTMGVSSQWGKGSTFWFELPFSRVADILESASPSPSGDPPGAAGITRIEGLHILAVDDNLINRRMIERALQGQGATVSLAGDGEEALRRLREQPGSFDLVLMDIQMPVMDGLAATRAIRLDPSLAHLPVVALTAGVMAGEHQAALDAGVDEFLPKPLNLTQMNAVLAKLMSPGGPPDQPGRRRMAAKLACGIP